MNEWFCVIKTMEFLLRPGWWLYIYIYIYIYISYIHTVRIKTRKPEIGVTIVLFPV